MNTIFYFTGTGNSLKVAKDIAAGVESPALVSIAANIKNAEALTPAGVVGFVFPVYYGGLPKIVDEFMKAVNLSQATYLYVVCAYAATGGNGGCISQAQKILKERGYTLHAAFYVKTVDNFILWTWDVPVGDKQIKLHENAHLKAQRIAEIVSSGKSHFDKSMVEHIAPKLFRYRHFYNTVNQSDLRFFCTEECKSCGLCVLVCPTNNIQMNMLEGVPNWKSENCQRCLACLHLCPSACIQYGKVTLKRRRYKNPYVSLKELKRK